MGNHNKASLASLSCFRHNSNPYNFSSNENMTLKLHIMTHFDTIFCVIQFFLLLQKFLKIARRPFMNMVYKLQYFQDRKNLYLRIEEMSMNNGPLDVKDVCIVLQGLQKTQNTRTWNTILLLLLGCVIILCTVTNKRSKVHLVNILLLAKQFHVHEAIVLSLRNKYINCFLETLVASALIISSCFLFLALHFFASLGIHAGVIRNTDQETI